MKNALLLLLFILALSSCTIEKRRYFKGYHVENGRMRKWESEEMRKRDPSTGSGTGEVGKQESEEVGKQESVFEEQCAESEPKKPQRGDIVIAGDIEITSPEAVNTWNSPLPIQNTASVMGHKKSHALEGLGAIFLFGIITLAVVIGLVIFLFSDSAIAGLIGGLIVGLLTAIGIYLLLIFLFVALLLFIIKTFGA